MNRYKLVLLLSVISFSLLAQNSAESIFKKASDQIMVSGMELNIEQKTTDSKGRIKSKKMNVLRASFGEIEKTKITMLAPERAKGVTIVFTNIPNELGKIEVFTPANGKIRKMKATPQNMAMVGSDVSASDYAINNKDNIEYKLLESQKIENINCYTIELSDKTDSLNKKTNFLINSDNYRIMQVISFDGNNTKTSHTKLSNYRTINSVQGKLQPMHIVSEDFKTKKKSEIIIESIIPRPQLKESDFILKETVK